jgi:hypothetical protein
MTSQLNVDTIVDKAGSGGTNVKIGNTSTYVSEGGSGYTEYCARVSKSMVKYEELKLQMQYEIHLILASITDNGTGDVTQELLLMQCNMSFVCAGEGGTESGTSSYVYDE